MAIDESTDALKKYDLKCTWVLHARNSWTSFPRYVVVSCALIRSLLIFESLFYLFYF
jgi:hypothetical protein